MKIKDLIRKLNEYDPETRIAYDLWLPEDIICFVEDSYKIKISHEDAEKILEKIEKYYDSDVGINWSIISFLKKLNSSSHF